MLSNKLIILAKEARENAYAPYSKYKVGCAIELSDGTVITGCNIENSSYGLTNCAERTAIFKAVSEGRMDFKKIAIIGDEKDICYPCGACRQVIMEFAPFATVVCAKNENEFEEYKIGELLPNSFKF